MRLIAMLVLGILLGIVSTQLLFPIQEGLFRFLILAFGISVILVDSVRLCLDQCRYAACSQMGLRRF